MKEILSLKEQHTLKKLEVVIEKGLSTVFEVGMALQTIRDERLYRAEYKTFKEYCKERWGFYSSRARQLIASAKVIENLKSVTAGNTSTTVTLPGSERQTRSLAHLKPKQQKKAWKRAIKMAPKGRPTAKDVEEAAEEVKGTKGLKPRRRKEKSEESFEVKEQSFEYSPNMADQINDCVSKWIKKYGEDIISIRLIAKIGRKED